jgi:hypothetical protein
VNFIAQSNIQNTLETSIYKKPFEDHTVFMCVFIGILAYEEGPPQHIKQTKDGGYLRGKEWNFMLVKRNFYVFYDI